MEKDAKKKDEYRKIVDMAKYTQDMKRKDEISRMKSQISKNNKTKSPLPKNVKIAKEKADQFMKATKKGQKLGLKRRNKNKDLNKAEKRMRQAAASKPNLDFGEFHSALGEFRLVPSTDPHNPKIKGYRVRMKGTPEQNKLPDNDELSKQKENLQKRLNSLTDNKKKEKIEDFIKNAKEAKNIDKLDYEKQKVIVRNLVSGIKVFNDKVEINWNV